MDATLNAKALHVTDKRAGACFSTERAIHKRNIRRVQAEPPPAHPTRPSPLDSPPPLRARGTL